MWKAMAMNKYRILLFASALSLVIAGCAPRQKTLVVVVPERDGKVGAVTVTTPRGETLINSAYAAVSVKKDGSAETLSLTEQDVKTMFNDTLKVRPIPPLSFTFYFLEGQVELTPESKQRLSDVLEGKEELTPESKMRLSDVLAEISRRGSNVSQVTVVGHTDRVGKVEDNDRLALQRAQKVAAELVGIGIPIENISIAGRGEREPMIPTEDEVVEPRNRRVVVSIL
jgi:OOP family OmpA-OmpF porin